MRFKSCSWIFIPFLLAMLRAVGVAQIATTQIVDTIYHADGTTATGTVLIAWPAFATINGDQVPSGNTNAVITQGGALTVSLIANSGSIPIGSYYTVTYHLDDNSVTRQYWVVPQSATPVKVAAVQSTVLPTSVAIQIATKTYVDTAIAAATTGHPLDSTPLVLKAGDTMTGPLVLPADPVSSLQASTKHYVDTAVASHVSTSITGQTPNYVPLATSATASAASSHFFEQSGYSGVANPFVVYASTPSCNLNGSTYTQYACSGMEISDDGSTPGNTPRNVDAFNISMNAWGPGGYGNAEGRSTKLFADSNNAAIVTPGIKQLHASNTSLFGIGDTQDLIHVVTCNTGVAYQSDQGCQNYLRIGQQGIAGGAIRGYFNGTVRAGGTSTQPLFTYTGGCTSAYNQVCAPSPGTWIIDTSAQTAAGKVTGASTVWGGGPTWIGAIPTDQTTLPVASAWGYKINANLTPATTWDAPVAQTFTLQGGAGTFANGDLACVIGTDFTEQQTITTASGSSPTQTITLPLSKPEVSIAIFKGGCSYLSLDADLANLNVRYAYPAVSIDGINWLYVTQGYSQNFAGGLPYAGSMWAQFDGGPNSGFHTYKGARLLKVGTTRPSYHPFDDSVLVTYLEPNSAFAVGDTIEDPDYPLQKIDGLELTAVQNNAAVSAAALSGLRLHIDGPGAADGSALFRGYNDASVNFYTPWGGRLNEPAFMTQTGAFGNVLSSNYTPLSSAFYFNNHQPGQTSYEIWHDPSWGSLSIDSTNSLSFSGSIHATNAGVFSGGASFGSDVTIGANTSTNGSLDVRRSDNPNGFVGRFAAAKSSGTLGTLFGGIALGQSDAGNNYEEDKGFLRLQDDGAGHRGTAVGVINASTGPNTGTPVVGFYMSAVEAGNGISIANGATNCATLICLGPAASVDGSGNISASGIKAGPPVTNTSDAPNVLSSSGLHSVLISGTNTSNNRIAFVFQGNHGGTPTGLFEFGTDLETNGTKDFYIYDYATGGIPLMITPTDGVLFGGTVTAPAVNATTLNVSGVYKGPATAPSGACSDVGWAFSQDGHISYCNGTSWIQKM